MRGRRLATECVGGGSVPLVTRQTVVVSSTEAKVAVEVLGGREYYASKKPTPRGRPFFLCC